MSKSVLDRLRDGAAPLNDPDLNDDAAAYLLALDSAVVAERERWRVPVLAMHDAVLDTMASGRPIAHLESACDALVQMLRPNV